MEVQGFKIIIIIIIIINGPSNMSIDVIFIHNSFMIIKKFHLDAVKIMVEFCFY